MASDADCWFNAMGDDRSCGDILGDTWTRFSCPEVSPGFFSMAGQLVRYIGIDPADEVLDVACQTGTTGFTAAIAGADVMKVNGISNRAGRFQTDAEAAGAGQIDCMTIETTRLPFEDDCFDVTLSCLGHLCGHSKERVVEEFLRVTKPGGRIGFVSWTPTSLVPSLTHIASSHLLSDAPSDQASPGTLWNEVEDVQQRLESAVEDVDYEERSLAYPSISPDHFWRTLLAHSTRLRSLIQGVDEERRSALREEAVGRIEPHFDSQENAVEIEYLLSSATLERAQKSVAEFADAYDEWAETYDEENDFSERDEMTRTVIEHAAPNQDDTVVDLGTGTGAIALSLAPDAETVIGRDISEGMLEEATKKAAARSIDNVQFGYGQFRDPDVDDADIVVSNLALHHLGDDAKREAIETIAELEPRRVVFGEAMYFAEREPDDPLFSPNTVYPSTVGYLVDVLTDVGYAVSAVERIDDGAGVVVGERL